MQFLYFSSPLCLNRISSTEEGEQPHEEDYSPFWITFSPATLAAVYFSPVQQSFTRLECHSQHTSHPGDCSQHRWLFVAEYM